ncbi:serine hydrolase domain-containing protein [Ulvibacterium marinum]|uniref:serine hydrolase domain-containing protein n=1 Tax=Ulvibacterium marinum TaxID=2419782 RepID=UPI002494DB9F|nr:serine hydrolase domain-containing protein [Ulvibacterium marinum]
MLLLVLFSLSGACQQAILEEKLKSVNQLLKPYDRLGPGYAIGIIKDGELIFSKGYGYANLDHNVTITDSSIFYIGSMAKQFTAAGLLILAEEGKLDFKKEVGHYLPEFPEYDWPILVEHLVHHTSGIRETNSLQLFQGVDLKFEEVFDTQDLLDLVLSQKELNFQPGEQFRYSSGGYAVLAKIIERISGTGFRKFLKERVFDPLGMHNTFVSDNHNEIIKNRVTSYWPVGDTWERRSLIFNAYGDGGIMTSVQDLVKWDKAFYQDILGVKDFAKKMYKRGILNNGNEIDYARALQVMEHKGHEMVTHNGGMLGFRVDMVRFPKERLSIIVLGNSAFMNPTWQVAVPIADLFLKPREPLTEVILEGKRKIENPDSFVGKYFFDDLNNWKEISFRNDSLYMNGNTPLTLLFKNEFTATVFGLSTSVKFVGDSTMIIKDRFKTISGHRFDDMPPRTLEDLKKYIGRYRSSELNADHQIYQDGGRLLIRIADNAPIILFPDPIDKRINWNSID